MEAVVAEEEPIETWDEEEQAERRRVMVERQLRARDIVDRAVLEVFRRVPRHQFVPANMVDAAYEDRPLPIGRDQTISQPYIVALTTQVARPRAGDRALDIGTGSGYQAAVLGKLVRFVHSVEIKPDLASSAAARLKALGYDNVEVRQGDGYLGWPEAAPFDIIVMAAATPEIPPPLLAQLARGGRLVAPVGDEEQTLVLVEKRADGSLRRDAITGVRFVPMTGVVRQHDDGKAT